MPSPIRVIFSAALALGLAVGTRGAELAAAREFLAKGEYAAAIGLAKAVLAEKERDPEWSRLLGEALMATGEYAAARAALALAVQEHPLDLALRLAAYEAAKAAGKPEVAQMELAQLDQLGGTREFMYRTPELRVVLGRVALLVGADPKRVLELFYDPARKEAPDLRDPVLASGELALAKNDFALAAKTFSAAVKKFPEDAEAWFGLARSFAPSDTGESLAALGKTLQANPHHVGAHLLLAEHQLDAESYDDAERSIAKALATNPRAPEAHALRAVLAHLRGDEKTEKAARAAALESWPGNPAVPHLIGRKLSQKYRFAEGAAEQRAALKAAPDFLPAKMQLANDLLRLGETDEGWRLAEEVQQADPYDVVAYNLVTLRDVMKDFRTLTSEHFIVRMHPREADVYGAEVLALLERAYAALTKKYGLTLREKTIVEIFPDQKDFAIRTFGLPGGAGYLGVCFGRVITANSPAARPGSANSWQAVLWHEFAHVVTLTATKNKMPRWLSEGISVFEERQARGSWGEQMKPLYRRMMLSEDLTPVSQLSGAFLRPRTPAHLGFAYYQSSLAVEWLVEKFGLEKMRRVLADLARGVGINAALAAHFAPLEKLDADFAEHARALARNTGPKLDWTKPARADLADVAEFLQDSPNNFDALLTHAQNLLLAKKWAEAKAPLQKLIELYPNQHDADSAYSLLARAHRELGELDAELAVLTKQADLASDATDAFARLAEIHAARLDWPRVVDYAGRLAAVNPLRPEPHRLAAQAGEATGDRRSAISAYRTLLRLDPPNPADTHFRLARLLHAERDPAAKRHVLLALEEAPRFREAHALLIELAGSKPKSTP